MLPQRADRETSAQGFTRLIWCTYREQNPHCNFPLFSHTVPSFDPGAVADGKGAGPYFLFFLSLFAAISVQLEPARKKREDEDIMRRREMGSPKGERGHKVKFCGRNNRWKRLKPDSAEVVCSSPSLFIYSSISVRRWEGNSFLHRLPHEALLIVANVWHNSLLQELCCVDGGLASGTAPPDHWEGNCWGKKIVRSPLGAAASGKHWGPVGSQWGWTCFSWVTSDPRPQQKKT